MIKVNKEKCEIEGTLLELLAETSVALRAIKKIIAKDLGEDAAKTEITHIYKLALMSDEEIHNIF